MYDPAGPQLPQRAKKVNYDMINIKLKSEIIVKSDQLSSKDSVQVADTIEKGLQITPTFGIPNNDISTEEEVDLMNFDDDCLKLDFNNNHNTNHNVQHVSMIDQLLCDLNFGREPLTTKNESKLMKQDEQITPDRSEQEMFKKEILVKDDDKMMTQNKPTDVFMCQNSPTSSSSDPSYIEFASETRPTTTTRICTMAVNGTQLAVTSHTYNANMLQMIDHSRIKSNGTQSIVSPRTHIAKETQTDLVFPATEKINQKHKPIKRKIYSFVELLIYQFSPITKELHEDVNRRFSHYVVDYDLLKDNSNQPRHPGILRDTIYQQRNGWNGRAKYRSMDYNNDRFVTSPARKHFESPSELSFLKECVIAQNRWTAVLNERKLRTHCIKNIKYCKSMNWINEHMDHTDKHSEDCLAFHMVNGQKNKKIYYEENIRFEEKDYMN